MNKNWQIKKSINWVKIDLKYTKNGQNQLKKVNKKHKIDKIAKIKTDLMNKIDKKDKIDKKKRTN